MAELNTDPRSLMSTVKREQDRLKVGDQSLELWTGLMGMKSAMLYAVTPHADTGSGAPGVPVPCQDVLG